MLRLEHGFNFDAFVEETGLGRGYISELERGLVVPSLGALARVAATLDLTPADLLLGDSPRERLFDALRRLGAADQAWVLGLLEAALGGMGGAAGDCPRRPSSHDLARAARRYLDRSAADLQLAGEAAARPPRRGGSGRGSR